MGGEPPSVLILAKEATSPFEFPSASGQDGSLW